jgi:hypothetical protein
MANQLAEYLKGKKCEGFSPHPYYSSEGDFLTYYFTDDDSYAQRVDDTLTVYLSMLENEFVGFKLKGIRNLLDTLGEFAFRVTDKDGNIMLGLLFWAGMQHTDNYLAIEYYQQGAERTKAVSINRKELQPTES